MIWLPRKVRAWYENEADTRGENVGEILIQVLIKHAFDGGCECSHPPAFRVLHHKGHSYEENGKLIHVKPTYRCKLCGMSVEAPTG